MKPSRLTAALTLLVLCLSLFSIIAAADDKIFVKGKIKDYDLDAKTVVITADDGREISFIIENTTALKKLDDRLFKDDEVKIKYVPRDGKNFIKGPNDLKGTKPGC